MHLQSIGKYVTANHIVCYLNEPDVQKRWKIKKTISLATAQRWMHRMGYRWTNQPSGQFVDGHERADVVAYRQNVFLPEMAAIDSNIRSWKNGLEEEFKPWPHDIDDGPRPFQDCAVLWYHNESTFYMNDHRNVGWVHKDAKAVPHAKGKGPLLMVADFVSTNYGWLCSPDKSESAGVLFKAGASWEGYFTNEDILAHARCAMNILEKHRPNEDHKFVFDNALMHLK